MLDYQLEEIKNKLSPEAKEKLVKNYNLITDVMGTLNQVKLELSCIDSELLSPLINQLCYAVSSLITVNGYIEGTCKN
jgi:hypothetical protein